MRTWLDLYSTDIQDRVEWMRLHRMEDMARTREYCREFIAAGEEKNDPTMVGVCHLFLGETLFAETRLNEAVKEFDTAYPYLLNGKSPTMTAVCCLQLGSIHLQCHSYEAALSRFLDGTDICEKPDRMKEQAFLNIHALFQISISNVYSLLGDYMTAEEYILSAKKDFENGGRDGVDYIQRHNDIVVCVSLIDCYLHLRRFTEADALVTELDLLMEDHPMPELDIFEYSQIHLFHAACHGDVTAMREYIDKLEDNFSDALLAGGLVGAVGSIVRMLHEKGRLDMLHRLDGLVDKILASDIPYNQRLDLLSIRWEMYSDKQSPEAVSLAQQMIAANRNRAEQEKKTKLSALDSLVDRDRRIREVRHWMDEANHDALTGMWNRRYTENMFEKLKDVCALSPDLMVGIGAIDVDFFKPFNDNYGHVAGDKCLQQIADILLDHADEDMNFFRFGGDEFVLIASDLSSDQIKTRIQAVFDDLRERNIVHEYSDAAGQVTLSIGVVVQAGLKEGTSLKDMLYQADQILYQVKENGKNGFQIVEK